MKQLVESYAVVVMEAGSGWPAWLGSPQAQEGNSSALSQLTSETSSEFAQRVVGRVEELASKGRVGRAVLSCCEVREATVLSARFRIARALLRAMSPVGGELIVSADTSLPDPARHELLALLGLLCEELPGTGLSVHLRFSENLAQSQTRLRAARRHTAELLADAV